MTDLHVYVAYFFYNVKAAFLKFLYYMIHTDRMSVQSFDVNLLFPCHRNRYRPNKRSSLVYFIPRTAFYYQHHNRQTYVEGWLLGQQLILVLIAASMILHEFHVGPTGLNKVL